MLHPIRRSPASHHARSREGTLTQWLTQAGMAATQALREGDRPSSSSGPDLKDKS